MAIQIDEKPSIPGNENGACLILVQQKVVGTKPWGNGMFHPLLPDSLSLVNQKRVNNPCSKEDRKAIKDKRMNEPNELRKRARREEGFW